MITVGLTGGIGSGKTTVANIFAEKYQAPVIDADIISREITQPHQPAFDAIIKHFSSIILLNNGELDRKQLRDIIFADANERAWLEKLLHPIILSDIKKKIQRLKKQKVPYCLVVIPLLLEIAPLSFIDRILVVDATEKNQIDRVKTRDHANPTQVEAMLKTQLSRELRNTKADDLITNHGTLSDLESQVDKLHHLYLKI